MANRSIMWEEGYERPPAEKGSQADKEWNAQHAAGTTPMAGGTRAEASANFLDSDTPPPNPDDLTIDSAEKNPLSWQRYFNQDSKDALNQSIGRVSGSQNADGSINHNGDLYQTLNHGIQGPQGQLKAAPMGAYSGGDSPMTEAISRKYSGQADLAYRGATQSRERAIEGEQSKDLATNANQLGVMQKLKLQNYKENYEFQQKRQALYYQWQAAKAQAKAAVISSAIGAGATILGSAAGAAIKGGTQGNNGPGSSNNGPTSGEDFGSDVNNGGGGDDYSGGGDYSGYA